MKSETTKYFSVHFLPFREKGEFSIWIGNIENTPSKLEHAKEIYKDERWLIEFHDYKHNMDWVTT
jgi:hypothetical protein